MNAVEHADHRSTRRERLRVVIVGGGVAALETALALSELAGERVEMTVIAPNDELVCRPEVVREPFGEALASRYPLARVVELAGGTLQRDELGWIEPGRQTVHTRSEEAIEYDALVLALGARAHSRWEHAITIDDRDLDRSMHGLIQDVEGGYVHKLAFVAAGRMAWPLPLYELALMTAGRAYDASVAIELALITPEDRPLAIFGSEASDAVAALLARRGIEFVGSAYVEMPEAHQIAISPGARGMHADRVVALPELFGPEVRGIPLAEHGFVHVDPFCKVPDVEHIYAAGDVTDFPVKHGGLGSQQADVVACSIAALAGADVTPVRFDPTIRAMLLTDAEPLYLTAHLTGGDGRSSELSDTSPWSAPGKIVSKYLAPCLERLDREAPAR